MSLIDEVTVYAEELGAELSDKKGVYKVEVLIAERKAFLSKKKLRYIAKFRINDDAKELKFTEMLAESGSGLSSGGGDFDGGMSTGFGFKTETYKTGGGGREGSGRGCAGSERRGNQLDLRSYAGYRARRPVGPDYQPGHAHADVNVL